MGFYRNHLYPHLVGLLGNPKPIREVRQRIIPLARGRVLEIGVGTGANFPYYDPAAVSKLYAVEPNRGMVRLATRRLEPGALDVEFLALPGEGLPLEDASVDTVVTTFTLCTVPDPSAVLRSVHRVLRRDGTLIFCEIGASPDPGGRRWQERWEPVHKRVFEGLALTRDIPALIAQGGFRCEAVESGYLARFPKSWTHCWWGTASRGDTASAP